MGQHEEVSGPVETPDDRRWMSEALAQAEEGMNNGELPVGAVVVLDGAVVSAAHTAERETDRMLVHADLLALVAAESELGRRRRDATLYVNLEPCFMCLGAAMSAMVGRVVYGLESPGDGAAAVLQAWDSQRDVSMFPAYRLPAIQGGVMRQSSAELFRRYAVAASGPPGFVKWATLLGQLA